MNERAEQASRDKPQAMPEFTSRPLLTAPPSPGCGEQWSRPPMAASTRTDAAEPLLAELDRMVGMAQVKAQLRDVVDFARGLQVMRDGGIALPSSDETPSLNMLFLGPPGTGKTTVARMVARILHEAGLIASPVPHEVAREDLVSRWIGDTAGKVRNAFDQARGKVLFLDEAYSLASGGDQDHGREAIDAIVKLMEDRRRDTVVIMAGYDDRMREFLSMNPGLRSRFDREIRFPHFSTDELVEVFRRRCEKRGIVFDDRAEAAVRERISEVPRDEEFGNARLATKLYESAVARLTARVGRDRSADATRFEESDILSERTTDSLAAVMADLDGLVGLAPVKAKVRETASVMRVNQLRRERGMEVPPARRHLVLTGRPGTGKTTVARLIGRMYKQLGALPTGQTVVVTKADLVAGYIGQTAPKTRQKFKEAVGGVLFIDEAYTLTPAEDRNDFGREALEEVMTLMEQYKDDVVVIVAGYAEEMGRFLSANPGVRSRFPEVIDFPDYSEAELMQILEFHCGRLKLRVTPDGRQRFLANCRVALHDPNFGNARWVEVEVQRAYARLAERLVGSLDVVSENDLSTLTDADFG